MILRFLSVALLLVGAVGAGAVSAILWFSGAAGQLPVELRVGSIGLVSALLGAAAGVTAPFRPVWGVALGFAAAALLVGTAVWGNPAAQQFARENAGRYNPAQFFDFLGALAVLGVVMLIGGAMAWFGRPK